ncbi:MAG: DNA mismatch repair endonuclease MutL [Tannerellaceae bacterium]|jgi:DNA mismatch repair protein MutL|nr:DNA mismatch repair endonuclease MutL [Tannerellaceae bacterium]
MSDVIHLLPDSIANQIAAGEVIQRPASVVKELVENAIDAGATSIKVYIKEAGKALIQVVDNGKGMSSTDARMAFERHATSKISTAADLFALQTMGFRGEALASIAAVAQVELRTRLHGSELGTRLLIAGSTVPESTMDACDEGSNFSVKNLFFNVPARRRFLKSNDVEFRHILNEFERIALVNPQVNLSLYRDDAEVFVLQDAGMLQRIVDIYGKGLNRKLLPVGIETTLATVSGFVARPDTSKKRGWLQYFFVNGRYMKHSWFHKAVITAYEQLIPAGEMPDYFIYISVDPATIDVNIHPTKTEIKFENEQAIWQILLAVVRESLARSSSIPSIDFDTEDAIDIPVYIAENVKNAGTPSVPVNKNYNPFSSSAPSSAPLQSELDWQALHENFEKTKQLVMQADEPAPNDSPLYIPHTCIQYRGRFIMTTLKSGVALIDQHRAHTSILFEQYLTCIRQRKGAAQKVLFPEIIELTAAEEDVLSAVADALQYAGFELSPMGNQAWSISAIPAGLEKQNPAALLKNTLAQALETGSKQATDDIARTIALSLARAAAIPCGKVLSEAEMDAMVAALFSLSSPTYTPNGKLVLFIVSNNEIEKMFQ